MQPTYEPPSTLALLDNAAWVLRLARNLIADEHLAQDVAQEAMTAAIERPPTFVADPNRLRRWLSGVTRRLAARAARRERGRLVAEGHAARREADTTEAEADERLRLHERLTRAVLALEAPYRSVLVMRYFDDLAPHAIAKRLCISPGAARTRLSRALDQLRARLDREYGGDRRAWSVAVGGILRAADDSPAAAQPWAGLHKVNALVGAASIGVLGTAVLLQLAGDPVPPLLPDESIGNERSSIMQPLLPPHRLASLPDLVRAPRAAGGRHGSLPAEPTPGNAAVGSRFLLSTVALLFAPAGIAGAQTIAAYDAGTAGNPSVAPSPVTQGWTEVDLSNAAVTVTDVSPDGNTGLNAWQIDDQATFNGGLLYYEQLFMQQQLVDAFVNGWELEIEMRIIGNNGVDIFYEYATGQSLSDDRYLLFFERQGADVLAIDFLSGNQFLCVGAIDGNHHVFTLRKAAGVLDAEFVYDGLPLGVLPRAASDTIASNGGVRWGTGASGATATANFHSARFAISGGTLGTSYCGPAIANSTGHGGLIGATGSDVVAADDVTLTASQLPQGQFGYFLSSQTQASTFPVPNSQGTLCLGGAIGRYNAGVFNTGSTGTGSLQLDLANTPTPTGTIAVQAGETWNFTAWYRDLNPNATSNFTDGVSVTFQ